MTPSADPKLLDALAGLDAEANMEVVQRTRRAVMEAANQMREAERRGRRNFGTVLLVMGALVVFLTPTLWLIAEDIFSGEAWQDAQTLAAMLVISTASTIFASVLIQWSIRSRGENA
ncbi:MAG TPA: hypothetical protein VME86_08710 [Acidobacteriaceae bacterium]|nr:hypothetical protein [Acidobacteriaceae bacterium]